jgi:hypothetical protein
MRKASQRTKILLLFIVFKTLLEVSSAQDTSGESPCQMGILVFDDLNFCSQDASLATAAAFVVADGQCRAAFSVTTLPSDPEYSLLPGNYRAECMNSTAVRFLESGCISDQCSTTSLAQGATCARNNSIASSLYSRATPPEYRTYSGFDPSYTCTSLSGSDVAVAFVIFGDCSAPACAFTTPPPIAAPVSSTGPTNVPSLATPPVFFSTGLPTQPPNSTIFQPPSPTIDSGALSLAAIIGIAAGGTAGLFLMAYGGYALGSSRRRKDAETRSNDQKGTTNFQEDAGIINNEVSEPHIGHVIDRNNSDGETILIPLGLVTELPESETIQIPSHLVMEVLPQTRNRHANTSPNYGYLVSQKDQCRSVVGEPIRMVNAVAVQNSDKSEDM